MSEELMERLEKTAKQWPDFQTEYEANPGQRQGVENDKRVIAGDHLPYMAGMGALPGLGAGLIASSVGAFGKSGVGKAIGTGVSTIGGAGLGYSMGKGIQERIENFNEDAINELSAKEQLTDQEQFFLDRARMVAGQNKTASEMMERLEKTASIGGALKGVGNYAKNVFGVNVRKAQNKLNNVSPLPTQANKSSRQLAQKDLHNAKVDRNIAVAGTAGVATIGGAGLGGYTAYQKSKEPVVDDIMKQNQVTQVGQQKVAEEELMDRLEKTANEAMGFAGNPEYEKHMKDKRISEIMVDLMDADPKYLESALQQEGLMEHAIEQGVFRDLTPGQGAAAGGIVGGVAGGYGAGLGGMMGAALHGGNPLKTGAKFGVAGTVLGGAAGAGIGALEGLYRKHNPSDLHLKYHGGEGQQATAPDVSPAHEENPRQGAGSVSNAPAGVDKSASELMDRLEKTAAEWREEGAAGADLGARFGGTLGALGGGVSGAAVGAANGGVMGAVGGGVLGAAGGGLLGAGGGAAGFGLQGMINGAAKDVVGYETPEGESHVGPSAAAGAGVGALMGGVPALRAGGLKGALVNGAGSALTGGLIGAGIGAMRDHREEKQASEGDLMERLEKTAAAIPGVAAIKGAGTKAANSLKGYANNVTGKNYRAAKTNAAETQKTFDTWNTPEALKANAPKIGVSNFRNKLEGLEGDNLLAQGKVVSEKAKMKKAIGGTAAAGGALAVGGGLASAAKQKEQAKVASEVTEEDDVLTGLFKEAAAAIIDEKLPEVKQHVDPMSRIKF